MKEVGNLSQMTAGNQFCTDHDELSIQHHRYQQFYKGIPVQTGNILHEQQGD
ncbi:MAG: hypothetical protein IPL22_21510 [Bacteroidetes bacterium]|nr:hypothetical protein [Bacteroidota bacterium]